MRSARRRKPVRKTTRPKSKLVLIFSFLAVLFGILFVIFLATPLPGEQLVVVHALENEEVKVAHYDFNENLLTEVTIPADTVVTAGYGYGEWRIGSLRKLGEQEGMDGELLRMSLTKTYAFPVTDWIDGDNNYLTAESSLTLKEKIHIAWFTMRLAQQDRNQLSLTKTEVPSSLAAIFAPKSNTLLNVGIYDNTGRAQETIAALSKTLHMMGGDWVVIEQQPGDTDCLVRGKSILAAQVTKIFHCTLSSESVKGNFDVEIEIGKQFAARF